jgi:Alpha/beta hydrolase domain containing 18
MHLFDLLFGLASRGPRFFEDGWGDRVLSECAEDPERLMRRSARPLDVQLGPRRRAVGGSLCEGTFASPEDRLPACARTARVNLLLPEGETHAVVLHLAASGDQGFQLRLRFAAPLLQHGIGALVLENAYYGARRPERQLAHALRSVSDLYLLGAATFQEGRALLRWLRQVGHARVGVTGFSMGGQLAAMVGASMDFPVAVVPVAPTCSADSVLRGGVLRHAPSWARLAGEGETEALARERLLERLARFSVTNLPAPAFPPAAIVVGTELDGVVPPSEMRRIAEYWGAELRWLPAGHVSAVLRHQGAMRLAILDAVERLPAARAMATRRRRSPAADPIRALFSLAARADGAAAVRHRHRQHAAGNRR